jgi:hypothetical protein
VRALSLALAALLLAGCSRRGEEARAIAVAPAAAAPVTFDWERPASALSLSADEVAARLGSFEWSATVEWTVSREGEDARRAHVVEHHRVRQAATGEFEAHAELDPGLGAGSLSGKDVVWAGGMTYARARFAPFRERPTDHGRDARRFRDDSFLAAAAVARLAGPGLEVRPAGEASVLRRAARRFTFSLAKGAAPAPAPTRPEDPAPDEDTKRRRAFLDGLRPQAVGGELLLDAATGAPLRLKLTAVFAVANDPGAHAGVEVVAQVKALGGEVTAIAAPKPALPDERKASGVANALEAAGLKKRGEEKGAAEQEDEEQ